MEQVLEQILNFLSVIFHWEIFPCGKSFADAFIPSFWWKTEILLCCSKPKLNWTPWFWVTSVAPWVLQDLFLFLLCWTILLPKWRFHKVQFHRRDNLTTKPKLLGNLSKQSPQSNSDKAFKDYRKMQLPYSPKIKCVDSGQTKIHCLSSRRSKHSVSIKEVSGEHVSTLPSQN